MEKIKKRIKQSVRLKKEDDKFFIVPNEETTYSFKILLTNKSQNVGLMNSYSKHYVNIYVMIENEEEGDEYGFYGDIKIYDENHEHLKTIYVSEFDGLSENLNIEHLIDEENEIETEFLNKNIISPDISPEKNFYFNFENLYPVVKTPGGWRPTQILETKWRFNFEEYSVGQETEPPLGFEENNVINLFILFELESIAP